MTALVLGCITGVLIGALGLALRSGLVKIPDPQLGAFSSVAIGFLVVVALAAGFGQLSAIDVGQVWPFLAIGVMVPGVSQIFFLRGVQDLGPSRYLVVMSTGPLFAGAAAVAFLGEPLTAALAAGTILVLGGGIMLAWERTRPAHFKLIGVVWALSAAGLFASRDILGRWLTGGEGVPPLLATTAMLGTATITLLVYLLATRRGPGLARSIGGSVGPFLPAGVLFGVGYATLLSALDMGRVTVVAPLFATYALWGVVLSLLVLGKAESIGRRTVFAAVLVVGGISVIGIAP